MTVRPLAGRHVVTTRDERGRLDSMLAARGADVIHVPLIEITEPDDDGAALRTALDELDRAAWLVVTSRHGAHRVGAAAAQHPSVRLAAVGAATARVLGQLAGRSVDLVPERQTAADLLARLPSSTGGRLVLAQADRAGTDLASGLTAAGWSVIDVTAYSTRLRRPSAAERTAALSADAVTFASGSAATAWFDAIGPTTPPAAVAIGPSTQAAALEVGLQISHVATDQNLEGLADAVTAALGSRPQQP